MNPYEAPQLVAAVAAREKERLARPRLWRVLGRWSLICVVSAMPSKPITTQPAKGTERQAVVSELQASKITCRRMSTPSSAKRASELLPEGR